MASKRYVANNRANLQIVVTLPDSGQVTITFNTGYGLRREGYFLTSNEAIQKAFESDKRYNLSYRLEEIDNIPLAEYEARKFLKSNEVPVSNVKTFRINNDAKDWINSHYGIPYSRLINKAMLTEEYAALGFELQFEEKQ